MANSVSKASLSLWRRFTSSYLIGPKDAQWGDDDPQVHTLHSATWINEFPEVTKEELGLLRGIKADVEL